MLAALAVVTMLGSADARAATPSLAASAPPIVPASSLPFGKVPSPPRKKPSSIGAGERASGIFLTRFSEEPGPTIVTGSRNAANRIFGRALSSAEGEDDAQTICLAEPHGQNTADDDAPRDWDSSLEPAVQLYEGNRRVITAVHREQLVERGGEARLEITDAWVDTATRGARLVARSTVPMRLVATVLDDIRVYAARDEGRIQIVLAQPPVREGNWLPIVQQGSHGVSRTNCAHARAALAVERGSADTATFVLDARLPTHEESSDDSLRGLPAPARSRPLHVHASVSWATQDKEPIVSVSFGWDAREHAENPFRRVARKKKR
jgi:hypothetical protein